MIDMLISRNIAKVVLARHYLVETDFAKEGTLMSKKERTRSRTKTTKNHFDGWLNDLKEIEMSWRKLRQELARSRNGSRQRQAIRDWKKELRRTLRLLS